MQAKPYDYSTSGGNKLPGVGTPSSGYKKPGYTGANIERSSSKATMGSGASPYRPNHGSSGGAKAGNGSHNTKPGAGPMGVGAAYGAHSYPTRDTAVRHSETGLKNTMKHSKMREHNSSGGSHY